MPHNPSGRRRHLVAAAIIGVLLPLAVPMPAHAAAPTRAGVITQRIASIPAQPTAGGSIAAAPCLINQYYLTRQTACSFEGTYEVQLLSEDNTVIARLPFQVMSEVVVSGQTGRWVHTLSLIAGQAQGDMSGTAAWGSANCLQNCSGSGLHGSSGFNTGSIVNWAHNFDSPNLGSNAYWGSRSGWDIWFTTRATNPVTNTLTITPPPSHRCDNALPGLPMGCTFPQVTVTFAIGSGAPTYSRHVGLALNHGVPRLLTRTTSAFLVNQNTSTACPGPDAAHPWPAGFICEAYPYHSTREGAQGTGYTWLIVGGIGGGGAYFNCQVRWLSPRRGQQGGYSVCMIPLAEFTMVANALNTFYYLNRIIEGDRFNTSV